MVFFASANARFHDRNVTVKSSLQYPAFRSNLTSTSLADYVASRGSRRRAAAPSAPTTGAAYMRTVEATGTRPVYFAAAPAPGHVTLAPADLASPAAVAEALRGRDVEHLVVKRATLGADVLLTIAELCPFMTSITLQGVSGVPPDGLAQLVRMCAKLGTVSIARCPELFEDPLSACALMMDVGQGPLSLQELRVVRCGNVTDAAVLALGGPDAVQADEAAPTVTPMPTPREDVESEPSTVDASTATVAAEPAPPAVPHVPVFRVHQSALQVLDLTGCQDITDTSLAFIASFCPRLDTLSLSFCDNPKLTSGGIAAVTAAAPALKALDLSGCSQLGSPAVVAICTNCHNLVSLSLAGLFEASADAIVGIARSRMARQLVHLDLTNARELTGPAVIAIAARCPKLQTLNLTMCSGVTKDDVAGLATRHPTLTLICPRLMGTDAAAPAFLPGFKPPPPRQRFEARKFFSTVKPTGGSKKKKKGKR